MARSRYPRQGHRLAPTLLRELLEDPVPAECLVGSECAGLRLCDLDETVWQRFSSAQCQELARQVLHAVGRSVRLPAEIGQRRLPPIPRGMSLADLDLEARTVNCLVAAGIHERPQDLPAITIQGVMGFRGFWVKSLVDLLTALEFAADHPEVCRRASSKTSSILQRTRRSQRYPRKGHRVAPQLLNDLLFLPLPQAVVAKTPLEGRNLSDLDETVWNHLNPAAIAKLAKMVVGTVNVSCHNRVVGRRRLPTPPKGIRLEDLAIETRTYNCLRKAGFDKRPQDLGKLTVRDAVGLKAFGAKCLVDLLTSLETLHSRAGQLDDKLTDAAKALAAIPGAGGIHFSDPRLGPLLRTLDSQANTVDELVHHVLRRRLDPPDPLRLHQQLQEIHAKIRHLTKISLEQELVDIFSPAASRRDRQIIAEYYGWDGGPGHTLEQLGRKYRLSRERVRQVCVRAVQRNGAERFFAPVLDRVLMFVAERIPAPAEQLEAEFAAAGFSSLQISLDAVCEAARFLAREPLFAVTPFEETRLVVPADAVSVPRLIVQSAKRAALSYGATTIDEVAAEVSSQLSGKVDVRLVRVTLEALGDFRWLDQKRGWFQLEAIPQYGLPNMIEKILSVAGGIGISKLRAAVARYRRSGRKVPPTQVLAEFCRRMPNVRVKGTTVYGAPARDWREVLSGVEAGMVDVLRGHGPVMERSEFEQRCVESGMNRFSFNAVIMCSPVVVQFGRSVYGLVGAKVDQKTLDTISAQRAHSAAEKVLQDYGKMDDGRIYLVYRLSKAAISGGVLTVPAAVKQRLRGKFGLREPDGSRAGTLVSKNGCAWGVGPVLRAHDAAPGDQLTLLFDTAECEAEVRIAADGDSEPSNECFAAAAEARLA